MIENNLALLKKDLQEALCLDLDDFGLETEQGEIISRFIGFRLRSVFQPVCVAEKFAEPLGYEALLRPLLGTEPVTPSRIFGEADNLGKLVKLDRVARTLHMLNYLNLPDNRGLLLVNVHPKLLASVNAHGKVFERILHSRSVPTRRVVIEIRENPDETDRHLIEAIFNYRGRGYQIAIADFGGKHFDFDRIWKLSPDYIKLDAGIIKRAESSRKVRLLLRLLVEIPLELGVQTIVAGIDNETQYKIALDAGARLLQGDFPGRPASAGEWKKPRQAPLQTLPIVSATSARLQISARASAKAP